MNTREERMQICGTILAQFGGNKFKTMTGAKNFMALDSGLTFQVPGTITKNHINLITITLDQSDTYTMLFENFRGRKQKTIAEHSMVYDDMLQRIFTAETGLDTHL